MLLQVQNIYDSAFHCVANLIVARGEILKSAEDSELLEDFLSALYAIKEPKALSPYFILPDVLFNHAKAKSDLPHHEFIGDKNHAPNIPFTKFIHDATELMCDADNAKILIVPSSFASEEIETIKNLSKQHTIILKDVHNPEQISPFLQDNIYFYGKLIERPQEKTIQELSVNKTSLLKLVSSLMDANNEIKEISDIIKTCPILSTKLLRFTNSSAYRGINEIKSIDEGVIRLGQFILKKLAIILLLSSFENKPKALIRFALLRATLCESISQSFNFSNPAQAYTVGLLSTLDAFIDLPIKEVLSQIPLAEEAKDAILFARGELGEILNLATNLQHAKLKQSQPFFSKIYTNALINTQNELDALYT